MLEFIRKLTQGWIAKVILILVTIPFLLFGIDAYLREAGSTAAIAKVNGTDISIQEYANAVQNFRNKLQSEGQKNLSILEKPEVKQSILDRLITTHLLNDEIKTAKFKISNDQLSKYIVNLPEFQDKGQFSQEVYDKLLMQNHLTPSQFEGRMRSDLLNQQIRDGLAGVVYLPKSLAESTLKAEYQQREVSIAEIKAADFVAQTKVDPAAVKAYYEQHKESFKVPEQVKLEFTMLSANTLIPQMQVSEDESKKFYAENGSKFQGDEQRHASHILISFGTNPTPQAKEEAKKKAEQVLAEVKKSPEKFAELAKKYSQDTGSAVKGGELDPFRRDGTMVKPFEDAVFSMKPNEISGLVESSFGYHIIKLLDVSGQAQGYDELKPQIRAELMYQKALSKFTEQAENFSNMVYEQSGSLKPAADAFGLQVQKTDWLSRADGAKFFKNDKLMSMVFTDEVLKDKRNTEAVEVSNNTLVSARVVDYKPSAPRSFDEVKNAIEEVLKLEQASKLAIEKGSAAFSALKSGKEAAGLDWIPAVTVDRKNAQGLTDLTMSQVFKIDASKLPAYAGVTDPKKGYLLIKVSKVSDMLLTDEEAKKSATTDLKVALATEYIDAYVKTLRAKTKVTVNQTLLQSNTTSN